MKQNTQNTVTAININALSPDKHITNDSIDQEGGKLFVYTSFTGYDELLSEIKTLATVIEVLSLHSCATDQENLDMISTVARVIHKMTPDMGFIDDLLFQSGSSNQNFKQVKDLL